MSSGFGNELAEWLMMFVQNESQVLNNKILSVNEAEKIISEIIRANFSICLRKYLKGEPWRLDGNQPTDND